ncbi:DUF1120 domain-containing protein [Serratia fonticola]|uniref:DUF1120 domain-containing protein n=1 Tax=Serratia fonticola TaxID=47917 RepID=UPI002DBE7223|nr:DUF1120 domain-containing protein [Serratia fonticola]MEB7886694.1 DUF1120 domain-containing protein [Serratia fonticola]
MKKHIINTLTLSTLLLAMTQAQAADALTAELKVVGELTVPTCTVAATDDGVYDIGKQSSTVISATSVKILTAMTKTWTVTCDAETYMNFTPVDNRAASKSSTLATAFGLGNVNGTGKIGFFEVTAKNAQVDSVASSLFTSATATFTPVSATYVTNGMRTGWATTTANTQKSGKVFVADIVVTPVLASSATMNGPITDTAKIDGSVTLNFAYGI